MWPWELEQLTELESCLIASQQRNVELEQQCFELQSALDQSSWKYSELQNELNAVSLKYSELNAFVKSSAEHESRASVYHQGSHSVVEHESRTSVYHQGSHSEKYIIQEFKDEVLIQASNKAAEEAHFIASEAETEARIAEAEEKLSIRDSEASELNKKLIALQGQLLEVSTVAETRKIELEETLEKLKNLESIVDELKTKPSATVSEKDETYHEQLQTSKKIASLLEENNLLNEKLKEAKENLNAKISEKSIRVKELEQQLVTVKSQLKQEPQGVRASFRAPRLISARGAWLPLAKHYFNNAWNRT